ncbi:helix-turn-helix domain-containing protein [Streptomyces sp. NPDC050600]|uniref:helix-turn-helix domain-containing protein n=1 Tax=Streptomyces sp. NPDC050600 TaxID=3157213 RepID=UPI0034239BF9
MQVDHLLRLDRLDLALVWGDRALLGQEVGGVTATDLEDPARFLEAGEIVLSGLLWWSREGDPAKADRFVSGLSAAGAVALLAGEETHGGVPDEVVDACRRHRVALLAVPAHTSFRAVTEAVCLRQWGELSRRPTDHYALPENVRADLDRALEHGASIAELTDRAFAHLGTPDCHLLTGSGRTVARAGGAAPLPARRAAELLRGTRGTTVRVEADDDTAFDAWHLHLPEEGQVPPRVLQEIAELLGRHRRREDRRRAARATASAELLAALGAPYPDAHRIRGALTACGLGDGRAYTLVAASLEPGAGLGRAPVRTGRTGWTGRGEGGEGGERGRAEAAAGHGGVEAAAQLVEAVAAGATAAADALSDAVPSDTALSGTALSGTALSAATASEAAAALAEALGHLPPAAFTSVVAECPGGEAMAVVAHGEGAAAELRAVLGEAWPLVHACRPGDALHAGVGEPVTGPDALDTALAQARYALAAARAAAPSGQRLAGLDDLRGLDSLVAGIPAAVREVYRATVLGPLLGPGRASHATLLETLEVFLAHDCSWARTAEALHLHVNTVHYRIERVEALTGRDLSRLDHKLDLRAALLCR